MIYADDILTQAAETYRTKRLEYGDTYEETGQILSIMLSSGGGAVASTRRWLLSMLVLKLGRYAHNLDKGHQDSLRDLIVYAALLEAYDTNHNLAGAKDEPTERTP